MGGSPVTTRIPEINETGNVMGQYGVGRWKANRRIKGTRWCKGREMGRKRPVPLISSSNSPSTSLTGHVGLSLAGGGGGGNRAAENWGEGFGKRAQLTGTTNQSL